MYNIALLHSSEHWTYRQSKQHEPQNRQIHHCVCPLIQWQNEKRGYFQSVHYKWIFLKGYCWNRLTRLTSNIERHFTSFSTPEQLTTIETLVPNASSANLKASEKKKNKCTVIFYYSYLVPHLKRALTLTIAEFKNSIYLPLLLPSWCRTVCTKT